MQHIQIISFFVLFSLSTFVCVPSFGNISSESADKTPQPSSISDIAPPCPRVPQEDEEVVSLQETLERAYMQNAELDAARAGLRATDETVSQANAEWRPSLSVEGGKSFTQTYPIHEGTKTHANTVGYTATLTQNVFQGGKTVATIGKTESNVLAGKAGLFSTEQNTLLTAVQVHTTIVTNQEILGYRYENESFNKQFLERTQARFEVGEVSRTDVAASEGEYEGAKASVSESIGNLESAKASYVRQIGSPPGKLTPPTLILDLPTCYKDALEVAKIRNPLIAQAKYALEAAEYVVDEQIAALLPTVNVSGTAGNDRHRGTTITAPYHPKNTNLGFRATVNVPIYLQGIPNSKIREAYQIVAQKKVEVVNAQRQVVEAVRTAWEKLIAAQNSVKSLLAEVKARKLAVEGAVEEYNVGLKSVVDALFEQQKLIESQIKLAQARQELILSSYRVLVAMGRLTACDLRLRVKYYDPDTYYNEFKEAWIQFWKGKDWRYVKDEDLK